MTERDKPDDASDGSPPAWVVTGETLDPQRLTTLAATDPGVVRSRLAETDDPRTAAACVDALHETVPAPDSAGPASLDSLDPVADAVERHRHPLVNRAAVRYLDAVARWNVEALLPYGETVGVILESGVRVGPDVDTAGSAYDAVADAARILRVLVERDRAAVRPAVDGVAHQLGRWPAQRNLSRRFLAVLIRVVLVDPDDRELHVDDRLRFRWGTPTGHGTALVPHIEALLDVPYPWDGACDAALKVVYGVARTDPGAVAEHLDRLVDLAARTTHATSTWTLVYAVLSEIVDGAPATLEPHAEALVQGVARSFAIRRAGRHAGRQPRQVLALTLVLVADLARLHPEPTATALAETRLRTLVRATATDLGAAVRVLARAAEHASTAASTDLVLALLEAVVFGHSPPVRSLTHSVRTLRTDPTNERAWLALGHLVDVLDGD